MNTRILYLLKRAEIESFSQMAATLETFNITPMQFTVLYFVDYNKDDLSSAQLSRRFLVKPQSMNELVAVLEKKNLLKKEVHPSNRRILHVQLTAKGKKLLGKCNLSLDKLEGNLLRGLSSTEIKKLKDLLGKLIETSRKNP
jgi:DNA-binding MarR family transcriptional regulator